MPLSIEELALTSVFEERAENLTSDELRKWTALTPRELRAIQKLKGPGAKLLVGPRGSGKSTLLKTAYYDLALGKEAFPVYVNFSKSLALEPLFHQRADALLLFRQWVLCKILGSALDSSSTLGFSLPQEVILASERAKRFIIQCEAGALASEHVTTFGPTEVMGMLEIASRAFGVDRCVLLMDDAAHAFSQEQQREFFEVFRELRSRSVACKAAVYPGITSYSPNMHVGHEAEPIEAWSQPDDSTYLEGMRQLVERRLPDHYRAQLADKQEIIDFLALAAFGIPRAFINMLADVLDVDAQGAKPTRLRAERAVLAHSQEVRGLFLSLAKKLPRYSTFVELGAELESGLIGALGQYNAMQSSVGRKASVAALELPFASGVKKILDMLEYAGLVRPVGEVSRGVKGRFSRYSIHFSLLIASNALKLGRSYPLQDVVEALRANHPHSFVRTKVAKVLGEDHVARCVLNLPPCQKCSTPRLSEEQRFCIKCGAELSNVSLYQELLQAPVEALALPQRKLDGIRQHTDIKTIQDVLLDDTNQRLRNIPWVGPVWVRKIRTAAMEFVGV